MKKGTNRKMIKMENNNLGIDISTKVMGYSICNSDRQIVFSGFLELEGSDIYEKGEMVEKFLSHIISEFDVVTATVEDFLKSFSGSRTTANTLIKLTQINTIAHKFLIGKLGRENLITVHPSSARKIVLGKGTFSGKKTKNEVSKLVESIFPNVVLEWTKSENIRSGFDDQADSVVLSAYPFFLNKIN